MFDWNIIMTAEGDAIRAAVGKRAVAKARPPSASARVRPVERAGRTLSAHTIETLKAMLVHFDAGRGICQELLDMHAGAADNEAASRRFTELMKQWSHALH